MGVSRDGLDAHAAFIRKFNLPFVLLCSFVLAAGLLAVLLINMSLTQGAYQIHQLERDGALAADQASQLQEELAHTENMVAGSRGHYNASVRAYDEARKVFPTSVLASMFNFEDRDYFEVETIDVRAVPGVSFE